MADALKNVDEPCVIVRLEGETLICGARQLTVTVTALLSAVLHEFVTRTQYDVVPWGATLIVDELPLNTGLLVFPFAPVYH